VPHATLTAGIEPIPVSDGPYQGKPNPHAWMSPKNALIYVENIRKALVDLDPANAAVYTANAAAYSEQIKEIDPPLRKNLAVVPEPKRFMVTCEGAFSYFTRDYDVQELYLWAMNSEQEGTPQQISRVVDKVKANQIPVVFCESTVSDKAQRQVAQEANAKFGGVFYVDSLTDEKGSAPTYLKLLKFNATTLVDGLKGKS
jgi:manganese transport system substrate-binding protein